MKLKYLLMVLAIAVGFTACKNDDDGVSQLPQAEQNEVDNAAIVLYLQQHYFNSVGKIMKFDDDDTSDDNETPLSSIAEQGSTGYWYVKRPGFMATGRSVVDNETDSILLQYEMKTFYGKKESDSIYYTTPTNYSSTINSTGLPIWDPNFYHITLTEEQIGNNFRKDWYEIEGFVEGIKHFNSSDKQPTDLPAVDFQGLIIIPSRLAYERDRNALNILNDASVIFNFELYQVIDRE